MNESGGWVYIMGSYSRCLYIGVCRGGLPDQSVVVELVLVDPDPDQIDTLLAVDCLRAVAARANKLKRICGATKVQFSWDRSQWKVFYLLTNDGKVLSSPEALAYRTSRLKDFRECSDKKTRDENQ